MAHAEMINSEKDFYREMIPHHQEAVDTSVLLYISTDDPELKMLTSSIYKAQTDEILEMRLAYARWYNLIPKEAMYQPMMRDLNTVTGRERDIRYVQDMIIHHKGALEMAEKVLQASAGSYMKAKHPEKSEEVQRLLDSVREEQQLAISLAEVLHAPTATSTTTSFSTPTPTHEQAIGLERFDHADVQANLLLRVTEANVGEDVGFRIELVNAGKAPALLIKVDEIMPEGFEIREVPQICAVEDSYLDLKGRRLNPLKTIDIQITVKPQSKGTFTIKPRVLYIDETGKNKSHEPEPVTITIKELGLKGWIKGEK
jgi:uncharacterized repeat protein (TIGR01451 family)